jgi:hypothetical protein
MFFKVLFSCLIFLMVAFAAKAQFTESNGTVQPPDLGFDSLKIKQNRIAGIKLFSYGSGGDTVSGKAEQVLYTMFDKSGRLTYVKGCVHEESDPCKEQLDKRLYYNTDGSLKAEITFQMLQGRKYYDSILYFYLTDKKLREVKGYYYNLTTYDDTLYSILDFVYNQEGMLTENNLIGFTRTPNKNVVYERNKEGKITKFTWYDENKKPAESGIINYDEKGRETGRQEFDSKSMSCKIICKFDKSGKCVERRCYDGQATQTLLVEYKYDGKGRLIDKYEELPDRLLGTVTKYKYDNSGNMIEKAQTLANGKKLFKYFYRYDEKGNLLQEDYYDETDELVQVYKYKYQFYK